MSFTTSLFQLLKNELEHQVGKKQEMRATATKNEITQGNELIKKDIESSLKVYSSIDRKRKKS